MPKTTQDFFSLTKSIKLPRPRCFKEVHEKTNEQPQLASRKACNEGRPEQDSESQIPSIDVLELLLKLNEAGIPHYSALQKSNVCLAFLNVVQYSSRSNMYCVKVMKTTIEIPFLIILPEPIFVDKPWIPFSFFWGYLLTCGQSCPILTMNEQKS